MRLRSIICLAFVIVSAPAILAQQPATIKPPTVSAPVPTLPPAKPPTTALHLKWPGQPGVLRYRLQVARDEQFTDIVFDRAVFGMEYLVTGLVPGHYYWRVAPAVKETGTFLPPRAIDITGDAGTSTSDTATETRTGVNTAADTRTPVNSSTTSTTPAGADIGWRTATGPIAQPLTAHLRSTASMDVVGVNSDGMAYGIDGTNGVALWAARFRPGAKRGEPTGNGGAQTFTPVLIDGRNGLTNVVVAFDGGLRALNGATGSELWRASLSGSPISGAVAIAEDGATKRLLIAYDKSPTLTLLNPENGKTISEVKLSAAPVAAPAPFPLGKGSGVIYALDGGLLEVRNANGERARMMKLDTTLTTPPLVVNSSHGAVVMVGSESGLILLNADELKPTGRVVTEGDAPTGSLVAADLDGDGTPEVVMITRRGRIAAITTEGKIKWHNTGATDAASVAFADLNGDGTLDVLVAGGQSFAQGFSGRDGTMIWRIEEDVKTSSQSPASTQPRALVTLPAGDGSNIFVIGTDSARTGLRAIGVPKDSVKAARE